MRIAFIAPFGLQPKGTVSARMVPLARALARRGHSVRIVIPPWDDPSAVRLRRPERRTIFDGQGTVELVTLPLPKRVPAVLGLTTGLVKRALSPWKAGGRTSRPDVIHIFKPIGYSGLAGFVVKALGVPWVLDTDDWEGPGGWADINPYSTSEKLAVAVQEALLPRMANAVTAASRTLEARAWSYGLPRESVLYLPNGISAHDSSARDVAAERAPDLKQRLGLAQRPILLLYTRFAEFPWEWALDILEKVAARRPDVVLLVAGSGFFGEESKLREAAATRGLSSNIKVVGRVPEEEVEAYLAAGDVLLYPMRDTLLNRAKSPVKLLEPMSTGLPIVAHRVGQAAEFLQDTGVLIEPGKVDEMAEAALTLLEEPGRRALLGKMARARAESCYDWDTLVPVAEQAYGVALMREPTR